MHNENALNLPANQCLPGTTIVIPYFWIGDAAFAHSKRMQQPFGGSNLTVPNEFVTIVSVVPEDLWNALLAS